MSPKDTEALEPVAHRQISAASKLNEDVILEFEKYLKAGHTIQATCDMIGVSANNYRNWMKIADGTGPSSPTALHEQFAISVRRAMAYSQMALLGKVIEAIPQNWQAAAWMLERKWPEQFSLRSRSEIDINMKAEVTNINANISDEDLQAALVSAIGRIPRKVIDIEPND